jgi:hypothetical protein
MLAQNIHAEPHRSTPRGRVPGVSLCYWGDTTITPRLRSSARSRFNRCSQLHRRLVTLSSLDALYPTCHVGIAFEG